MNFCRNAELSSGSLDGERVIYRELVAASASMSMKAAQSVVRLLAVIEKFAILQFGF